MIETPEAQVDPHSTGPRTRLQKRASKTRNRLFKAALQLFREKGIEATAIVEITELADLGKGTFYRHFSDKNEMVIVVVDDIVDRLTALWNVSVPPPRALKEAVERVVAGHLEFFLGNRAEFGLLFREKLLAELQADCPDPLERPYMRYLRELENRLAPHMTVPLDPVKLRRFVYATAGFVSGALSFAVIGLESGEITRSMQPLRQAFVTAAAAFLGGGPDARDAGAPERPA
ncbi:MAG TPA: TetR/AcrR family transcriptional regulator [Planctomycetota bacterium]|nr:MAG: HTH-type transcriptional regulator TtgR [Planctomycetes bacterium ADurb.Bin069]HNS00206.1 TetR/AcrR family transcriptional regulator [Planctomycetota bacterium]HNU26843.1 TetR/AcrR family transcriptional regulator [Planctomycetota bacterium]HOE31301.1 TetR/AcrR family transcriptional regulator [Planctomycetota bacterium]HOR68884.1 TetR/AcrR family transcriptional regulator [Planctomycetota bacterium]